MFNHSSLTLKLNLWEKIIYDVGDADSNLMLCTDTLYLLKFYTDGLGIPAYCGGTTFLVAKFFTAFTDMPTGFLLDSRKNIGSKGKFRPFILYTAVPMTLIVALQFIATTFCSPVKITIAIVLFMMFGLPYSLMDCSYGAMIPTVTKNLNERAQLAAYRQGGATVGLLICTVAFIPLQSLLSNSTIGYACVVLMFSTGGFTFMMLCCRDAKEHYVDTAPTGYKASILKSLYATSRNPPLLALCIANLCILATLNIKLAIQAYYIQYVLDDINLLSWMRFFSIGCILTGVLLVPVAVKCLGKKQVYLAGMVLWAAGNALSYFWGSNSFTFVVFSCVAFFGTAFINSLNWVLAPDTAGYGEWRTDTHAEGSVYTGYTLSRKISAALAGFLLGTILTQIGYVPNIARSDATLQGLRQFIFIWPYALAIIATLTMGLFYTPGEKRFALIAEEISQRKNKEMATEEKTAFVTLQVSMTAIPTLVGGGPPTFEEWTYYEKD